jgi:SAM-dependent methyltransferase
MSSSQPSEQRAADFGRGWQAHFYDFGRLLADLVNPIPGERALDIASGIGAVGMPLARSGAVVTAIDVARPMLERLHGEREDLSIRGVVASAHSLPIRDRSHNIVTCGFGIAFFADLPTALAEMRRVLVPGGRVAITWWTGEPETPTVVGRRDLPSANPAAAAARRTRDHLQDPEFAAILLGRLGFDQVETLQLVVAWREESVSAVLAARERYARQMTPEASPAAIAAYRSAVERACLAWIAPDGSVEYPIHAYALIARTPT